MTDCSSSRTVGINLGFGRLDSVLVNEVPIQRNSQARAVGNFNHSVFNFQGILHDLPPKRISLRIGKNLSLADSD